MPAAHDQPQANALVGEACVQVVVVLAGPGGHGVQLVPHESGELSGRHWLPQRWKPTLQVKSQVPNEQSAVPFGGGVHVWHVEPQVVTEFATHMPLQKFGVADEAHDRPQFVPSQVGVVPLPAGPAGHGEHRLPQVFTLLFDTHCPLHSWKPGLHCTPQVVPLQVATPKLGVGHGVHIEPHVATLEFDTHCVPHWWKPAAQVYWHCPATHWGFAAPGGG
ncbi:MAG: hypothetical protein MUC96_37265, partial [Myxococcaceae bacterium]|nr:hypothetical protein [Myxococcaceae bacterium]